MTPNRPNKVAKGFTKQEENRKAKGKHRPFPIGLPNNINNIVLKLQVRGTTDKLSGGTMHFLRKLVTIPHPTETGYFKQAYILNEEGRKALKRKRYQKVKQMETANV